MREPHNVLYSPRLTIDFPSDQADVRAGRQGQGRQAQCGGVGADAHTGGGPGRQVSAFYSRKNNDVFLVCFYDFNKTKFVDV